MQLDSGVLYDRYFSKDEVTQIGASVKYVDFRLALEERVRRVNGLLGVTTINPADKMLQLYCGEGIETCLIHALNPALIIATDANKDFERNVFRFERFRNIKFLFIDPSQIQVCDMDKVFYANVDFGERRPSALENPVSPRTLGVVYSVLKAGGEYVFNVGLRTGEASANVSCLLDTVAGVIKSELGGSAPQSTFEYRYFLRSLGMKCDKPQLIEAATQGGFTVSEIKYGDTIVARHQDVVEPLLRAFSVVLPQRGMQKERIDSFMSSLEFAVLSLPQINNLVVGVHAFVNLRKK